MSDMLEVLTQRMSSGIIQHSNHEIIGIEIRRKRLELSFTLSGLCFEICSPSYLCKIEKNQIQANEFILQELCSRVSINKEQQKILFNSYEVLLDSVKAYVTLDKKLLDSYVLKGKGFENYRYRIIFFIKLISDDRLFQAKVVYNELVKLLSSMQDIDMLVFSLFTVVLHFKERNYEEALKILNKLEGVTMNEELGILYSTYLFLTSSMLLLSDTSFNYVEATNRIKNAGYYYKLEDLNYAFGLYAIKTSSERLFDFAIKLVHDDVHKNSLYFLYAYIRKDMETVNLYKDRQLNEFCKFIVSILDNEEGAIEMVKHLSGSNDRFDFNAYMLKYMTLTDSEDKRLFILNTLEYRNRVKDSFVINYLIKELLRIKTKKPHNRSTFSTISKYWL